MSSMGPSPVSWWECHDTPIRAVPGHAAKRAAKRRCPALPLRYNPHMRVLYHQCLAPAARKVRVVLAEKNLEFTLKAEKYWERREEFLALNPAGEVPVLIEPDG